MTTTQTTRPWHQFALLLLFSFGVASTSSWVVADDDTSELFDGIQDESVQADDENPKRVIVELERFKTISGVVELEDETIIVVRDLDDEVHSFTKTRVRAIVRLVDPKPGQKGIIHLRNGQTRTGIIIDDAYDGLTVEIEGVRARLPREKVFAVQLLPTFDERYEEFKSQLGPGRIAEHLRLCRWLMEEERFELAREEILALLKQGELKPARDLLRLVEARIELINRQTDEESSDDSEDDADAQESADPAADLPTELLSAHDVNLIRVYELDLAERPLVEIKPETVQKIIANYGTSQLVPATEAGRRSMFRKDPDTRLNIVELLFNLRARELYPEIRVVHEPGPLNQFRLRVHDAWLIKNCATSACHGGPDAGRFFLHRRNHKDERVRYTNMLILERNVIDPDWPLINYEQPEQSLIIQYALPQSLARKPHPDVPGWSHVFDRSRSKLLDETTEWIKTMMYPRPEYPVKYDPPRLDFFGRQRSGSPEKRIDR